MQPMTFHQRLHTQPYISSETSCDILIFRRRTELKKKNTLWPCRIFTCSSFFLDKTLILQRLYHCSFWHLKNTRHSMLILIEFTTSAPRTTSVPHPLGISMRTDDVTRGISQQHPKWPTYPRHTQLCGIYLAITTRQTWETSFHSF